MKAKISIVIDTDKLETLSDRALANFWCLAQANPVGIEDRDAGEIAELVGREIIARWLKSVPPELWHHQGMHHFWHILQKHGDWQPVDGDPDNREWKPGKPTEVKS